MKVGCGQVDESYQGKIEMHLAWLGGIEEEEAETTVNILLLLGLCCKGV